MQNSTTTAYQINDDNLILLEWLTLLQNSFKDSGEEMSVSLPAIRRLSDELKATGFRYEYENPENNTILWSIGRNTLLRMREGKMRENELQKLQKWDDALLRYKFLYKVTLSQDKDALAHAVLDKLMQCYSNGSTHLTLEEPNDTQLACELVNVGMVCIPSNHNNTFFGPHQWKFLHYSPEALTKLTAAASEVRAEYHLEISRRQIHELAQIMASTFPVGEMITNVDFEDARRTLREFVQRFRDNYGAKPFLYGLRHVLQATHKAEKCQIWILHNDVFTQSGGAEFLNASVALLKVLDFRPRTPIDQWQFDGQDHRNKFSVSPLWSDKQLSHLLNTIPRPAQDEKPHGEFGESVVPRRPQPDQQGSSGGGFFQAAKEWTKSWWYGDTSSSAPKPATRKRERSPDDEPARTAIGDSVRAAAQSVPPPLVPNAPPSSHPPPLVPSSSSTNSNFSRGFGGAQQQQQHFHQHQADTRPSVEHFDQPAAKRARPNSSSNMGPVATPQQQQQQQPKAVVAVQYYPPSQR
eukprot:TRINITY_DN66880_c5_g8_i2.p1 TRINITY_DN66880_c5_g8~~TRINITY_DN66880_c5_g8_i2.p1  ORF type:complete len:523 (+),score=71.09 TRINITY_DN66880_c5_g8_i2:36-1604(+)